MADRDNKAIKGLDLQSVLTSVATEIKKKQDKTDSGMDNEVIASALVDLATRLVGVENRNDLATLSDLQKYCKQVQTAKSSPSASSTAIAFIDTISQNENGDITATKKTVRSATTEQTGVVQLQDSIADGVTSKAPTVNAVYDALALKENLSNKVKSTAGWSQTLSDDKYPSEKLAS